MPPQKRFVSHRLHLRLDPLKLGRFSSGRFATALRAAGDGGRAQQRSRAQDRDALAANPDLRGARAVLTACSLLLLPCFDIQQPPLTLHSRCAAVP